MIELRGPEVGVLPGSAQAEVARQIFHRAAAAFPGEMAGEAGLDGTIAGGDCLGRTASRLGLGHPSGFR